jgi:uncharacterized protein
MMEETLYKLVERYSKEQMGRLGLYGWPHVQRVLRLCEEMAENQNCGVDLEVLRIAALLHDVAKSFERDNPKFDHGRRSAEMAEAFLRKYGLAEAKIRAVCHAIKAHTHFEEAETIEAKMLHDADFIDKLGATGIATIFIKACLTNQTIEEVLENYYAEDGESYVIKHIQWIKKPHLYTATAKEIAKKRKEITPLFFEQLRKEIKLEDLEF